MTNHYHKFFPYLITALVVLSIFAGCSKEPVREITITPPDDTSKIIITSFEKGVFIVNEGNYNWGNASVTFFDYKSNKVVHDVFNLVNQRMLGDVAESMSIAGNNGYLMINNSNRIEVVTAESFKSVATINGLHSPRFMTMAGPGKAYVTNLQSNITIIDLKNHSIAGTIKTSSWTENMISYQHYVLVTSIGSFSEPSSGRKAQLFLIDTRSDRIIDSIQTGKEPIGMVIDKKDKVWVLCSGGYDSFEAPSLMRINPELRMIEKVFTFSEPKLVPSRLCINAAGDTMYYLRNGVCRMAVTDNDLPTQPLIPAEGRLLYGLAIQPSTGQIFTSDAIDYVQTGKVYHYRQDGTLIRSFMAGRIPGSFCFIGE